VVHVVLNGRNPAEPDPAPPFGGSPLAARDGVSGARADAVPHAAPDSEEFDRPGALQAGLGSVLFWASLAGSLVVAFVVTVPVNRR